MKNKTISNSNNGRHSYFSGLAFPIFGAFLIYIFASLILQQQKNNAESALDYLTNENIRITEKLGDVVNISNYRRKYIETEMMFADEINRRNSFLELLNSAVIQLPKASVIRTIKVMNNYVDLELEMENSDILVEYCQSLKRIKFSCNKKKKLQNADANIVYFVRLERD